MAATYSAFITTRFYSPVFNTALFDGPIRIYFSQSYESAALKLYHILQAQYPELWQQLKDFSLKSKEHVFLLMYPERNDLKMIFSSQNQLVASQEWEEGLAVGLCQPQNDLDLTEQIDLITQNMLSWIERAKSHEISL